MKWYRNIQGRPTHRRPFVLSEKEVAILADLRAHQDVLYGIYYPNPAISTKVLKEGVK